jgi:hypothetical protein
MLARLYVAPRPRCRRPHGRLSTRAAARHTSRSAISCRFCGDFNEDLRRLGPGMLRAHLGDQLAPADVLRFLSPQDALADKTRKMGIPVWRFGPEGGVL